MPASALDAVTVVEVEPRIPGGGGPPGPDGWGDGGGGDHDDSRRREELYRLGIYICIFSVTALFIGLALAFWIRSRTSFLWQPVTPPRALWASSGVLVISSVMLEFARAALRRHQWFAYRRRLLLTIYLALAFIVCQVVALSNLVHEGYYFRGDPHISLFYVFMGAHAVHLTGGMIALNYMLFRRGRNWDQHRITANITAIYWHFMGVLWLALFALLLAWK
jgi:cytochrome c oxidase subunit III